jgi:DNA-binding NarL/FixJ family response regulator
MVDKIRILLVDDHVLWRQGVAMILTMQPGFEVVGQGSNVADAERLAAELQPDIILLDISMKGSEGSGLDAIRTISATYPAIKIVMLTVAEDAGTVLTALKTGACGYVLKGVSGPELVRILEDISAGRSYITPELAAIILAEPDKQSDTAAKSSTSLLDSLTEREHDVLKCLAQGLSNKQIAYQLHLSEKTVKHHMSRILEKLQVNNRVEAALLAQKAEYVDD